MNKCCNQRCNQGRNCPTESELNGWDKAMLLVAGLGSAVVIGVWFFGGS